MLDVLKLKVEAKERSAAIGTAGLLATKNIHKVMTNLQLRY